MVFLISRFQIIGTLSKLTQQIQPPHLMHHLPEQISAFDRQIGKIYVFLALLSMHGRRAAVRAGCPRRAWDTPGALSTRSPELGRGERPQPVPEPGERGGMAKPPCKVPIFDIWLCCAGEPRGGERRTPKWGAPLQPRAS